MNRRIDAIITRYDSNGRKNIKRHSQKSLLKANEDNYDKFLINEFLPPDWEELSRKPVVWSQ